ncbi:unnamed protein product [Rotaria sp. Silwood2]|nr:unnamed protein product [Rotaria sp. Silwood2]CAF2638760.1 unnamed protein product [Rotaria sp. Silwood2]CAF4461647.1 unnamed protein product [Rotaria sp. Silwood2]CAF4466994.1 unnamed protein product [Rotaria sp. Silwood2]
MNFYLNHCQLSNNEENDLFLEFVVCRLLHTRITRHEAREIHIIIAALLDYDNVTHRGENLNIGSTQGMFLQVRIYALFQWLVKMKTNVSTTLDCETFAIIENELLHCLEAYYFLNDIQLIPIEITKSMNNQSFQQIESSQPLLMEFYHTIADKIVNKIEELDPKQEYIIPTGWRRHAICVSFRRIDQNYISIRIDNPSSQNPQNIHEAHFDGTGVIQIRPKVLGRMPIDRLRDNINYIILLIDSVKRDLKRNVAVRMIYDLDSNIISHIQRRHIEDIVDFDEQAEDNCFVKCFESGLRTRFGERHQQLCRDLKQQEIMVAIDLLNKIEIDSKNRVSGLSDRFTRFIGLNQVNRLPAFVNVSLREKIELSYKRYYAMLSNLINEECSHRLLERFIHVQFKIHNTEEEIKLLDLCRRPRVLVLGEAGSGKTTVCQYVAYSWARKKLWRQKFEWIFYISMRQLNSSRYPPQSSNYSLIDIIVKECFRDYTLNHLEKAQLEYQIASSSSSKVLWILDGCDERVIPDHLRSIEEDLLDKRYLLLTSRPYGTDRCHYDIKVNIQSFTTNDVEKYIKQYFSVFRRTAADACWSFVRYSDRLLPVVSVPVCLEILCILSEKRPYDLEIGMSVGQLIESMCGYLLRRYLLKFHGLSNSALHRQDVFQHPNAKVFTYLEYLAFISTQSHEFAVNGDEILNVAGALFLSVIQVGLLQQNSRDPYRTLLENTYFFIHRIFQEYLCARYMRRALTSNDSNVRKLLVKFITENKYNRSMRDTFIYFFDLKRTNICMKQFWSTIDREPRDLIGLRHCSRIINWFPAGICGFPFDEDEVRKRTIDIIEKWILNEQRWPHDFGNTYLFEWFDSVIDEIIWLKAWRNDLFDHNSSSRRYFIPELWSETDVNTLKNIYDGISNNIKYLHLLIENGPTKRYLSLLNINTDLFPPPIFDKIQIPKFLLEVHDRARRAESITDLENFRAILNNYSYYAILNRHATMCDEKPMPLMIATSVLENLDNETLELILQLAQHNALFYRDFYLPIIPLLKLYAHSVNSNERTLCSLIASIALSSSCIVTASPGQPTSIRVHDNRKETIETIELSENRRRALLHEFDEVRRNYGYSEFFFN